MTADTGLAFWLDYVDHHGGAFERTADGALVVLPPDLAARHGQGEEFLVTAEPDVAGEGKATLLSAGHPLLAVAAEAVLAAGDLGRVRLPRASGRLPDAVTLLELLRARFPVDHGRIDLTGGPRPTVRQILRVGALVTFELSADDQFQEHLECWLDIEERLPLPAADSAPLVALLAEMHSERTDLVVDAALLPSAVAAADEEIRRVAQSRRDLLSEQVDESRSAELGRAADYYREMIASLTRRRASASAGDPAKHAAYESRIAAAEAERDRRLAEINDKYMGSLTILPFRLQVVGVPALRLQVDVRRGERRYPLEFDWLTPTRSFASVRCPHCGSTAEFVAGKARLGCRLCLPKADEPVLRLVKPPPSKPAGPKPAVSPAVATPAAVKPAVKPAAAKPVGAAPAVKPAVPRPALVGPLSRPRVMANGRLPGAVPAAKVAGLGSKLVTNFWEHIDRGDGAIRRMLSPGSPAEALLHFFGVAGLRRLVGLADGEPIRQVSWAPERPRPGSGFQLMDGFLTGSSTHEHRFQMCWHLDERRALVDEITPGTDSLWPRLPDDPYRRLRAVGGLFAGRAPHLDGPTPPRSGEVPADEVTRILLDTTLQNRGLSITLRCVAGWLRLPDREELIRHHGTQVLAASLDRMISYRAGTGGAQYSEVARDYQVSDLQMKAASAALQRRLELSPDRPW